MSERNTLVRSMHDLGLAAWFGGALMGSVGLHAAASAAQPANQRIKLASVGWASWAPVQIVALVIHGIGGIGLIAGNKTRLMNQQEGRTNTVVKTIVTGAALAATASAAIIGRQMDENHSSDRVEGVTDPDATASEELANAQRAQRVLQWVVPALTGILIILAAQQGEQQRPIAGLAHTTARMVRNDVKKGKKAVKSLVNR